MTFSISTKIQDGGRNVENFFRGHRRVVPSTQGSPIFAQNHSISYGF